MQDITKEVIQEILKTYELITEELKEIKKRIKVQPADEEEGRSTHSILNEFFAGLEGSEKCKKKH
ncbi:hypothetical protein NEIG_01374 [Nematocida sp. ERTm5]|nr:hypothetical protein NEIRO02_0514 [Nematocida sp. AWRm79]KAI5182934.1 hypothetical protein NEIRO03_0569 [Nematocida sp. AWRm78]OAG32451.1 hypothetical protein NEIG_01374 [Nematocida sp. ERTm5]